MPTIAELQIKLDSTQVKQGTEELNSFAQAADRASRAAKAKSQVNNDSANSSSKAAKSEGDLTSMIDAQTRKLEALATQRRKLDQSGMKNTMPDTYEKLNRIIDANIGLVMRQGNAVDALNAKQERDSAKREAAAAAEQRAQERVVAAAVRQENILSRASARQQREIDSTINGLNRQIKAQNDYNRAIETLGRARDGGANGEKPSISSAEYDTYVKLAAARRDAALASEDNTRAITAAQSKLSTYTATLGRVERAEVEYGRAVKVLDDNLKLGTITQEQYNQQVTRFASHRDTAIRAANDNSAAEARFARELKSVMSAYDPVLRAQDQYNNSVQILSAGLQSGAVTVEQFNKALTEQRQALDGVKDAQSGVSNLGSQYDSALNSLVPYRAELKNLEQQERVLKAQKDSGNVTTAAQIKDYDQATAAIARQRTELNKRIESGKGASLTYKQEQAALRGVPAQITDIVVSLQGGQAPLTVLLQQGGQLKDMFGGVIPAVKALAGSLIGLINPATVVGTAVAAIAVASYSGAQEVTAFNRALIQSGGASGVTAGQFSIFREELDRTVTSSGKAAEALTAIEKSGGIAGESFVKVAEAAILMEKATGQALTETIADFTALGKDPVDAAVRLDEKYRFLTASVLSQADALVKQGREVEAVALLQDELSNAATSTAQRMIDEAGLIERAWSGVKAVVSETLDALKGIGRAETTGDQLIKLIAEKADLERLVNLNSKFLGDIGQSGRKQQIKDLDVQIKQLQQRSQYESYSAEQQALAVRTQREAVAAQASAQKRLESNLKGVEKAENDLLKVRRENEKIKAGAGPGGLTPEQSSLIAKNEAAALKEVADAREKANKPGRAGAIDNTSVQEVRSNLAVITAEYEGYYKRVTALGEANLVSDQATYYSQKAILEAQRKAVSSSYDSQISEINKLQENKKNSSAQNISLENQVTKAESARVAALEKIDTKLATLQTKENGRIAERTRNIASYKAALDAQVSNLEEEGARNADGVGRGSRQAGVARQLASNDRSFAKQQADLANSLSEGMDPEEYAAKLKDLQTAHTRMADQIIKNDREIQRANYDWTNGFTAAVDDALDAGLNFAGSMQSALTGAFNSAGDALAKFVTTGKFNFKEFALSVIADMAQIAARQAAMGALGALFNIAGAAAGSYFGAGATSAGSTQAGYTANTNYSVLGQAKGGAWSGGTQMFAQGGAFTNSIVATPTSFGMANGARGVMGEAGEEAIIPLARTRNGDLGVRVAGSANGSETSGGLVQVNVYVSESSSSSSTDGAGGAGWDSFGNDLGSFVRSTIYTVINSETRPGGTLQPQR